MWHYLGVEKALKPIIWFGRKAFKSIICTKKHLYAIESFCLENFHQQNSLIENIDSIFALLHIMDFSLLLFLIQYNIFQHYLALFGIIWHKHHIVALYQPFCIEFYQSILCINKHYVGIISAKNHALKAIQWNQLNGIMCDILR